MRDSARMQRIEFCFFDAGGGHRAAATALQMSIQAQERSWDVRLLNVQELLDELDILKRYAGIRIEDYYNWMLRSGWFWIRDFMGRRWKSAGRVWRDWDCARICLLRWCCLVASARRRCWKLRNGWTIRSWSCN